jgi:hypothetical protein
MKLNLHAITYAALITSSIEAAQTNNVHAIAYIESGDNMRAVGKAGERTAWQIMPATWACYVRPDEKLKITRREDAFVVANRIYAHNYVRFVKATRRAPTHVDVYAMWNLGFAGYKRRHFEIERCPRVTQDAALRYHTVCVNVYQEN